MKVVVISDTHGDHAKLSGLSGDVLVHCGDFSLGHNGAHEVLEDLDAWFGLQPFKHILCTGGNHDFLVEELSIRGQRIFRNATYLEDEAVEIEGFKFYGTPWVPELTEWAHYLTGDELARAWSKIPADVDVLVTHTPPKGILDSNSRGKECGCQLLRQRVSDVRPQAHCFGHIHASSGHRRLDGTLFVNASVVNSRYLVTREAAVFELKRPKPRA
jgi:Icc-related predicted phosphoesterase